MDRENNACGQKKSRNFTNMVNVHRSSPIVSTALPEHYCLPERSPVADAAWTDRGAGLFRARIVQYCAELVWRHLAQRGLPGLAAATLFALVHGGAHAQQAAATGAESWVSETGTASYYGQAHQGRRTADGSRFDLNELTAAHPWLPFGSRVVVTLKDTGRSVVVTITDRLYSARRVIDLSMAAARMLGMVHQGIGTVSLSPG
jgi:rare lipoprotein A